jgi:protocadherin-16/23
VTATDSDSGENARINYYIVRGNLFGTFGVHTQTGSIFVSRPVDYEECSGYSLQIRAVDSNTVNPMSSIINVNISIIDVNDNSPHFEENPVFITIRENIPAGTHIYTFSAIDRDQGDFGRVKYEIVSQSPDGNWFSIEPVSGFFKIHQEIDFEAMSQVSVVVKAEDQARNISGRLASTVSALVLIQDVNDNSPVFETRSEVYVLEDEPVGYPVMHIVATDADSHESGQVSFEIVSGNELGHFSLDADAGKI